MVTPTSLNGAGCAAAVPAASVDARNSPAIRAFMDASLVLYWSVVMICNSPVHPHFEMNAYTRGGVQMRKPPLAEPYGYGVGPRWTNSMRVPHASVMYVIAEPVAAFFR